jgi:Skp family chaperone for outer membrane proteins
MKNLLLTALLSLCTCTTASAQCNTFDCAYKEAQRLLNSTEKDKYTQAMAHLEDAENYAGADKAQYEKVRALRKKAFVAIEGERKAADKATERANSLLKQVETEKETALAEKNKAEAAEQKADSALQYSVLFILRS